MLIHYKPVAGFVNNTHGGGVKYDKLGGKGSILAFGKEQNPRNNWDTPLYEWV